MSIFTGKVIQGVGRRYYMCDADTGRVDEYYFLTQRCLRRSYRRDWGGGIMVRQLFKVQNTLL